jgi:outer membrane protein TolC
MTIVKLLHGKYSTLVLRIGVVVVMMCVAALCFGRSSQARELSDILTKVEQNTPALQAAHARTQAQQAVLKHDRSGYFGEINALVKNSNYNDDRLINPIGFPVNMQADLFDDNQIGYGVAGHIPLDVNGRITAQVRAADKELAAALANEGNIRLQVLHTAADFYHNLEGLKALERALEKQIEALTAHIRVVAAAIAAGRAAPVEKLRLIADQEAVKGKLAALKGEEQGIRARLAALMGEAFFSDPVASVVNKPVVLSGQAGKIFNRPDIQAVTSSGEAADARVRAAFATRLPSLNLDGSWMQNQGFNGEGDDTWALFATLQLPIWDGGGRRAAVEEARSNRQVLRHELAALRNQARAEVVAARADWQAAHTSYQASIASIKAARETERIQSDRFAEGRLSAADLVDAEAALASARSSSALALTSWWQAGDHLRRALGLEPSQYRKSASSSGQKH